MPRLGILREINYQRAYHAKTAQTAIGKLPIVARDIQWTEVVSGDTIRLADGRLLKLKGVIAAQKGEAYFEESTVALRRALTGVVSVARGPLSPLPGQDNAYEGDVFYFPAVMAFCGNTPVHKCVPWWMYLNYDLVCAGSCRVAPDAHAEFARAERRAQAWGSGMWADPAMLRKHVDLAAIRRKLLAPNVDGDPYLLPRVLARAGVPDDVAVLRERFKLDAGQSMHVLRLLLQQGHWQMLDQLAESFMYPNETFLEEERRWRYDNMNSELFANRLPYPTDRSLRTYCKAMQAFYQWYRQNRGKLTLEGDYVVGPSGSPGLSRIVAPVFAHDPPRRLASDQPFSIYELWVARQETRSDVLKSCKGRLYYAVRHGIVHEIDSLTGDTRVVFQPPRPRTRWPAERDLAFCGNVMMVATGPANGKVYGVSTRTWRKMWERPLNKGDDQAVGNTGKHFLMVTEAGDLAALDPSSGRTAWTVPLLREGERRGHTYTGSPHLAPALIRNRIVTAGGKRLLWIEPSSGKVEQRSEYRFRRISSEPAYWNGTVYAADDGEKVVALSWDRGHLVWEAPLPREAWPLNSVLVALPEGVLATERDTLKLLSHASGKVIWQTRFGLSNHRPMVAATERCIFCLVSEEDSPRRREGGVIVAFRRSDLARVGEWRIYDAGELVTRRLLAMGHYVYVGQPIRCLKVWEQQPRISQK